MLHQKLLCGFYEFCSQNFHTISRNFWLKNLEDLNLVQHFFFQAADPPGSIHYALQSKCYSAV